MWLALCVPSLTQSLEGLLLVTQYLRTGSERLSCFSKVTQPVNHRISFHSTCFFFTGNNSKMSGSGCIEFAM